MEPMLTYLLVTGLTGLAYATGLMDPEVPPAPAPAEPPAPMPSPSGARQAFIDELAGQSSDRSAATKLRKLLTENMAATGPAIQTPTGPEHAWAAVALPCDEGVDGIPTPAFIERIASTLAESYEVKVSVASLPWTDPERGLVPMCAVVYYLSPQPPALTQGSFTGAQTQPLLGAIDVVGMVVQTIIQAGVGTITTLGTQGLIRAMGGERRLARLVRRYKRTGNERIRRKIIRTASRLKGRNVDWNEIEAIIGESETPQPLSPPTTAPPPPPLT
jgi:hypothetical protein